MPIDHRHFRIFLSSPGDVAAERAEAIKLIDQLPYDPAFRDKLTIRTVAWDKEGADTPLLATMTPQEAINQGLPQPSECDIVVVIFWSRMGTPLPSEYVKADGSRYLSGTEWEYWDAFNASKGSGKPLLLMYRRTEEPVIGLRDPKRNDKIEQYERVEQFFAQFVGPMGELLSGYNAYDTPDQFRAKLDTHLKILLLRLLEAPPAGIYSGTEKRVEPVVLWKGSPFPGLRAFLPADEPIFFGRGSETDALVKRVAESRFVAVVGASGSGKSSLVGAGLIPRLMNNALDGSKDWQWLRCTPGGLGDNPFMALAAELKNFTERHGWNARQILEALASDPTVIDVITAAALSDQPAWAELLLFIDQFEELFTLVKAEHVAPFAAFLNAAMLSKRVRVVVTMRSDFYHRCVDVPELVGLLQSGSYPLGIPDHFALLEMIERPAERAGLSFEADLSKRIVRDTGDEPGGLALMAYTLDELYERCKGKHMLTHSDYEALGGVKGAIGTRAENTFATLDSEAQEVLGNVFRDLVEIDDNGTVTRKRAYLSDYDSAASRFVQAFVNARLLTASKVVSLESVIDVSHEALLTSWDRLVDWLLTTKTAIYTVQQVKLAIQDWERNQFSDGFLWSDERIGLVDAAIKNLRLDIDKTWTEVEKAFIGREWHWINHPAATHIQRMKIGQRLSVIGDERLGVGVDADGLPEMDWLAVPGGMIEMEGVDNIFTVPPFYISKYLTTNKQFQAFINAPDGVVKKSWSDELDKEDTPNSMYSFDNYPRDNVTWNQAMSFCRWLNSRLKDKSLSLAPIDGLHIHLGAEYILRLPTEWEWQQAATLGRREHVYPWGDDRDRGKANTADSGLSQPTAVGMYPLGASPVGVLDMAGNVWEWCINDRYEPHKVDPSSDSIGSLRGGSWRVPWRAARSTARFKYLPYNYHDDQGFRVVVARSIL